MSKPQLSAEEMAVWTDAQFMPLKQRVWDKLEQRLEELLVRVNEEGGLAHFPEKWRKTPGRLYRGEHYHSYSYRTLDLIRFSEGEDLALLRLVLLWGHPPGLHLILTGKPQADWLAKHPTPADCPPGWWLSCHDTPWTWEFPDAGWQALHSMTPDHYQTETARRQFVKIATFLPVEEIDQLEEFVRKEMGM